MRRVSRAVLLHLHEADAVPKGLPSPLPDSRPTPLAGCCGHGLGHPRRFRSRITSRSRTGRGFPLENESLPRHHVAGIPSTFHRQSFRTDGTIRTIFGGLSRTVHEWHPSSAFRPGFGRPKSFAVASGDPPASQTRGRRSLGLARSRPKSWPGFGETFRILPSRTC